MTDLTVEADGLTAFAGAATGIAAKLTTAATSAGQAGPALPATMFGTVGSGFVTAYTNLINQHAATITGLATTVSSMAAAATASATAYRTTDQSNGDAIARNHWNGVAATAAPLAHTIAPAAARSFHNGFTQAHSDSSMVHSASYSANPFQHNSAFQASAPFGDSSVHTAAVVPGGVQVQLPNGHAVSAPNAQAATAVRAALTQRGVPYVWGGTSPGQGLDCSGLTKYAYGQAGIDLPRLAQEQGNGHMRVDPQDLEPGDLAVWDGHVAMVIGDGQLIEAGDPVSISPIRTENEGMQFYGFFRPTAMAA